MTTETTETPTRAELDDLREQVALRVMGGRRGCWDARPSNYFILMPGAPNWDNPHLVEPAENTPPFTDYLRDVPDYPNDIAAAWQVVGALVEAGCEVSVVNAKTRRGVAWICRIVTASGVGCTKIIPSVCTAREKTVPEAICRGALQACPLT